MLRIIIALYNYSVGVLDLEDYLIIIWNFRVPRKVI